MCYRLARRLIALCAGFLLLPGGALAQQPIPHLKARVTDQTQTLSAEQRSSLESKLAAFEQRKGSQIAVLLVPSVKPESIEEYAVRAVEKWKLGRKNVDDGVLLLVAKQDRKLRIEVGYGLEGALNDATCKRIISDIITPRFKQGDFYGGIDAGIDRIIEFAAGENLPEPANVSDKASDGDANASESTTEIDEEGQTLLVMFFVTPVFLLLSFFTGQRLRASFARLPAAPFNAGIIGGLTWLFFSEFVYGALILAGLASSAFIITLLIPDQPRYGKSSNRRWRDGIASPGGWSGGSSSSSSSSSDSGFSGGGGSSGGGGASGDW